MIGPAAFYVCWKVHRYFFNRGSKSRNKVAVGEPAAGSFFRMIYQNLKNKKQRVLYTLRTNQQKTICRCFTHTLMCVCEKHGSHNVSRWMTWLPISLKNAAKCDKWYQLQNHSITESLNANGAREKTFMVHPRACRNLSVEHVYKKRKKLNARVLLIQTDETELKNLCVVRKGAASCDFQSSQKPSCFAVCVHLCAHTAYKQRVCVRDAILSHIYQVCFYIQT